MSCASLVKQKRSPRVCRAHAGSSSSTSCSEVCRLRVCCRSHQRPCFCDHSVTPKFTCHFGLRVSDRRIASHLHPSVSFRSSSNLSLLCNDRTFFFESRQSLHLFRYLLLVCRCRFVFFRCCCPSPYCCCPSPRVVALGGFVDVVVSSCLSVV